MTYYGTRLSDNLSRRDPEGYLLCLNVPVARTGAQEYLPEELGIPPDHGELITVYRPEDEVFSPECIASFEGMPVTNDHPEDPEGVTAATCAELQKGHAQNLRRGSGDESDLLIADLLITDPILIQHILSGKREISCGYNYDLCFEKGRYIQRKIRGNHIAVVDAGRAGHRVSIKDHERRPFIMQNKPKPKNILSRLIASFAKDEETTTEEVAQAVEAILTGEPVTILDPAPALDPAPVVVAAVPAEAPAEPPAVVVAVPAEDPEQEHPAADEVDLAAVCERLDRLITLLTPVAADVEEEADPLDQLAETLAEVDPASTVAETLEDIVETIADPETSEEGNGEDACEQEPASREDEERSVTTADAIRAALQVIKPVIAALPADQRRQVSDRLARKLRVLSGLDSVPARHTYAALKHSARRRSEDAEDPRALGRRIMAARSANR